MNGLFCFIVLNLVFWGSSTLFFMQCYNEGIETLRLYLGFHLGLPQPYLVSGVMKVLAGSP